MSQGSQMAGPASVDLSSPRHDLGTYWGRLQHFAEITDMRTFFVSDEELYAAKELLELHAANLTPPGTTVDQLYAAKRLYDSAFHPQSGELMWRWGRMSFCVPGNTLITGGMLTFYQSSPGVIFWQVANQSFNAVLNYVNRNTSSPLSDSELAVSYVTATGSATALALGLNRLVASRPVLAAGLVGRLVPFAAVTAANCVNMPLMRRQELVDGVVLENSRGQALKAADGTEIRSTTAAQRAIGTTVLSRVLMAVPGMVLPAFLVSRLQKRSSLLRRYPRVELPLQVLTCGLSVTFAMPACCALFPQRSAISVGQLESSARSKAIDAGHSLTDQVYFNKGL